MKLRYEVDQAECFRRGIDAPKSIVHLEVDPKKLSDEDRNLIADRLDGIDVYELWFNPHPRAGHPNIEKNMPGHIIAKVPGFDAFMEAIRANQRKVTEQLESHAAQKPADAKEKSAKTPETEEDRKVREAWEERQAHRTLLMNRAAKGGLKSQ